MLLALLIPISTFAQYGKISGTVVDQQTGEPLVGASVRLDGTALGASTDLNGGFVILNVPAGNYNVKTTYVGYHPLTMAQVSVLAGLTRELKIQLTSTAVQVSSVEVVAQKPLIEKSATNAIRIVGANDIKNLPVRGAQAYYTIQPGVVLQNGSVYIRGSRQDEVGYEIEGANVKNIVYGGNYITTIPEALQEVSVQAGGYGAEFGGSNSGIVQQTFKTGGPKLDVMVQAETDNFGNYPGKKFLDTYSYGYSDYVVTVGGPLMSDKIKFFLAGESNFYRDGVNAIINGTFTGISGSNYLSPNFWSGANFGYLYDTGLRGGTAGDSALVKWDAGNIPYAMNKRYNVNGTLLFDLMPIQFRLAGAFASTRNSNNYSLFNIFDLARVPVTDASNLLLDGKLSYFLSLNTFFEFNINYLDTRNKTYDPNFGDNLSQYDDSLAAAAYGWQYVTRTSGPQNYDFAGFPFVRPGTLLATGYTKNHSGYIGGSVDLTSQIGKHEIRIGGSYQYWTVSHYGLTTTGLLSTMLSDPNKTRDPAAFAYLLRQRAVNNYGYDEFGAPVSSGINAPKNPYFAAAYVQDRIEFGDLVVNAGLRLDDLYMDNMTLPNLLSPPYNQGTYITTYGTSRSFLYVEPRIGFSFPVTDRTVFHLQYGKFVQAPQLSNLYASQGQIARYWAGQYYFIGSTVAFNVGPIRTTQYEVGFSQQFTDFAAFDVAGFYKDVIGELQDTKINVVAGSPVQNYHILQNGDFETVMGLEFSLRMRRIQRLEAQINYTLQDARGTNSFPNGAEALQEVAGIPITMVTPLAYDQTHRGSIMIDYRWGAEEGGPILQQLGLNVLLTFNSGHPYTLATGPTGQQGPESGAILFDGDSRSRYPVEPINNSTTPWVYYLDARIDKTFNLGSINLNIYAYAQNVLNTKNVVNVFLRTGNAYDDGWLSRPTASAQIVENEGPMYIPMYQVINLQDNQNQRDFNGYGNFGTPRQIRIGARLEF